MDNMDISDLILLNKLFILKKLISG